jgi:hypothetical protein
MASIQGAIFVLFLLVFRFKTKSRVPFSCQFERGTGIRQKISERSKSTIVVVVLVGE